MSDRQAFDHLDLLPAAGHPELLAPTVAAAILHVPSAMVFTIDPGFADTAALCGAYQLLLASCVNCVIVTGRRGDVARHVACLALATTRVDINATVRRRLDARKASFSPMDFAVENSGMEYAGSRPRGCPSAGPWGWTPPSPRRGGCASGRVYADPSSCCPLMNSCNHRTPKSSQVWRGECARSARGRREPE